MEVKKMGATVHIKTAMVVKGVKSGDLAEQLEKIPQTFYNMLNRDSMRFSEVEAIADALGCDVVLRDRETGRIF